MADPARLEPEPELIITARRQAHWISVPVMIGGGVLLFWVIVALTVQWWAPFDPLEVAGPRLAQPQAHT